MSEQQVDVAVPGRPELSKVSGPMTARRATVAVSGRLELSKGTVR